jgi:hypothetical protein
LANSKGSFSDGDAALTLENAILVMDTMILKKAIRAAKDVFAPPPVSEEEAEELITYLASRGISATADNWSVDGIRALAAFRIVNRNPGIDTEIGRILRE